MLNRIRKSCFVMGGITLLCLFFGCASMRDIEPQAILLENEALQISAVEKELPLFPHWWKKYRQPTLNSLIDLALRNNPSLKMAQARVRQLEAVINGNRAIDGPHVDLNASITRQHLSGYGQVPPPLGGAMSTLYATGISFNYGFDIWGKTRAQVAAAISEKMAVQIEAEEGQRVLSLAISHHYFHYLAVQIDIDLLNNLIQTREAMLAILQAQYRAGILAKDQLDWMNVQLQADLQNVAEAKMQAEKIRHALAALVGTTVTQLPTILPSDLPSPQLTDLTSLHINSLGQRADIRAACWRVESYLEDIKSAKADFYPTISLAAFVGFNALNINDWFKQNAYQALLTPALNLPIFHAGALRAQLRIKMAEYDAAVENYHQTLLSAVQDAADKYAELASADAGMLHAADAAQLARSALQNMTDRYQAGLATRLTYLDSQYKTRQITRQDNAALHQRLQAELAMIQALGGSYVPTYTPVEK